MEEEHEELTKETLKSEGDLELLLKSSGLDFDQEEIFRFWKFLRENLGKTVTKVLITEKFFDFCQEKLPFAVIEALRKWVGLAPSQAPPQQVTSQQAPPQSKENTILPSPLSEQELTEKYGPIPEILLPYTGFFPKLPAIPKPSIYRPTSNFLKKNLPGHLRIKGKFDLRLLKGDLNNPEKDTPAVTQYKKFLKDYSNFKTSYLFLGGHGVGKTKTLFDIACVHWIFYFDFSSMYGNITTFFSNLRYEQDPPSIKFVEKCVFTLFLTRLIFLLLYMKKYPTLSPEDWRNLQLDGLTSSPEIEILFSYLFTKENLDVQIIELLNILKNLDANSEIIVALDEANVLIETYRNKYSNSEGEKNRSLFRPVLFSFGRFNIHIIIAGTYLSLNDENLIQSSAMKTSTSSESRKYDKFTNFRINTEGEVHELLVRCLSINEKKDIDFLSSKLTGRSRFVSSYIEWVEEHNSTNLREAFEDYRNHLINDSTQDTLFYLLQKFLDSNKTTGHKFLGELLYAYYINDGIVKGSKLDWMSGGLCLLHSFTDWEFEIAEL